MGEPGTPGDTVIISASAKYGLELAPVPLAIDGLTGDQLEQIGRGSYLVNALMMCGDCHGNAPTYLAGGRQFDLPGGNVVFARNLTPDVTGLTYTEAEFIEVMQTGRDFKIPGASLVVMPWPEFRWASTKDLQAIYAYLKVIPAVTSNIGVDTKPVAAPVPFPTTFQDGEVDRPLADDSQHDEGGVRRGLAIAPLDYSSYFGDLSGEAQLHFGRGSYLVSIAHCNVCHTNRSRGTLAGVDNSNLDINTANYLRGGRVFTTPPPPLPPPSSDAHLFKRSMSANLSGASRGAFGQDFFVFYDLVTSLRHSDGGAIAFPMPAYLMQDWTAEDLLAVWTYVNALQQFDPGRNTNDKATQRAARFCAGDGECTGPSESCDMTTNECVGRSCSQDRDCDACQTCSGTCVAPTAASTCPTAGI